MSGYKLSDFGHIVVGGLLAGAVLYFPASMGAIGLAYCIVGLVIGMLSTLFYEGDKSLRYINVAGLCVFGPFLLISWIMQMLVVKEVK